MEDASSSKPPLAKPLIVYGSEYVSPNVMNFKVVRNPSENDTGNFTIMDANMGNPLFALHEKSISMHDKKALQDPTGKPIITFREKLPTLHHRLQAYRGESKDIEDLIFTIKFPSVKNRLKKTKMYVFLAGHSPDEDVCDFKLKGSWERGSCNVYVGDSRRLIAKMEKIENHEASVESSKLETYNLEVWPNIDYAFVVALLVALDEMKHDEED